MRLGKDNDLGLMGELTRNYVYEKKCQGLCPMSQAPNLTEDLTLGGMLAVRKSGTAFVTPFMITQGFSEAESYPEYFLDRIFNRTLIHVLSMQQIECSLWIEI